MSIPDIDDTVSAARPRRYRVENLLVDLDRQTVQRDGVLLDLPDLTFRLLATLVEHAPNRVTKDELIREVWDDVVVSDQTLAQRVRLLRQALDEDGQNPRYIASVRGRGYRLVCPIEAIDERQGGGLRRSLWPAFAVLAVLAALGIWHATKNSPDQTPTAAAASIAVLPFADLSAAQDYRYFADGMQEELLTRLTKLANMQVLSRTSVDRFRSTDLDLQAIASQLGVDAVIEGSVRIAEDRVRITVQLIDAATDRHLWADNFERELSVANIFSIQSEVADRIARALQVEYPADTSGTKIMLPTDDIEAYDLYLLGRYHTFRQTPQDLALAVTFLEQATARDANFAEAYASLGWAYSFTGTAYGRSEPRAVYPKAKEAALRALALDSELADARSLYADILTWFDWDFAAAEREYKRTIKLEPMNVLGYALFLSTQNRHDEAIAAVEKRVAANPNDSYARVNAGWRYLNAGNIALAIDAATHGADHPDAPAILGLAYLAAGEADRAITVFEADLDAQGRKALQLSSLAYAYYKVGRNNEGQALLMELQAKAAESYLSPGLLAAVYFAAGDADNGFAMLDEAVSARAREVIFVQVDQMLKGHRDDPRYAALVREIGFE